MIYNATTNTNFALRFSSVLSVVKIGNLAFSYMHSSQSYEASNTKSVRPWKMGASLLKVLETVSQRAIDNFQSPLKRFTSRRHKIVKCVYLLSEMIICLSKQSKFATNAPISFIFNFWSPVTLRDHN